MVNTHNPALISVTRKLLNKFNADLSMPLNVSNDTYEIIEGFYFLASTFRSYLELLKIGFEDLDKMKGSFYPSPNPNLLQLDQDRSRTELIWVGVFSIFYSLRESWKDTFCLNLKKKEAPKNFQKKYPELGYCCLLRNDFIQHQERTCAFQPINPITHVNNQLPIYNFAPPGFGLMNYISHYIDLIQDTDFKDINHDNEQKLRRNKDDYIKAGGWKNAHKANHQQLAYRIKVYGLPPPNQAALAKELRAIYENEIIPNLQETLKKFTNN